MRLTNRYYKDRPDGVYLMSGLPLPKDSDGVVRDKAFVDCSFHPNCGDVRFEDCVFIGCDGDWYIQHGRNAVNCVFEAKKEDNSGNQTEG